MDFDEATRTVHVFKTVDGNTGWRVRRGTHPHDPRGVWHFAADEHERVSAACGYQISPPLRDSETQDFRNSDITIRPCPDCAQQLPHIVALYFLARSAKLFSRLLATPACNPTMAADPASFATVLADTANAFFSDFPVARDTVDPDQADAYTAVANTARTRILDTAALVQQPAVRTAATADASRWIFHHQFRHHLTSELPAAAAALAEHWKIIELCTGTAELVDAVTSIIQQRHSSPSFRQQFFGTHPVATSPTRGMTLDSYFQQELHHWLQTDVTEAVPRVVDLAAETFSQLPDGPATIDVPTELLCPHTGHPDFAVTPLIPFIDYDRLFTGDPLQPRPATIRVEAPAPLVLRLLIQQREQSVTPLVTVTAPDSMRVAALLLTDLGTTMFADVLAAADMFNPVS